MPVKSIHIAQAIREDLSDAYLRREVCPGLKTKDGRKMMNRKRAAGRSLNVADKKYS